MSIGKKLGAVVVGAGSLALGIPFGIAHAALQSAANKVGDGSVSDNKGNSYSGQDFRDSAEKCGNIGGEIIKGGFKTAKNLWND